MESEEQTPVQPKVLKLDTNTLVPIGMLLTISAGFAGGAVWLNERLTNIDYRLQGIETKIADRWNVDKMAHWAEILQLRNPTLSVPPVKEAQ